MKRIIYSNDNLILLLRGEHKGNVVDNKLLSIIIVTIFMLLNFSVKAQDLYTTTVGLNLRDGAGENYKSIAIIARGDTLKILKYENNWAKVEYNNNIGYSYKKYLKKIEVIKSNEKSIKQDNYIAYIKVLLFLIFYILIARYLKKIGNKFRSKRLTIVLSLFFGFIGLQKFYLGEKNKGVYSLIFCWTLIPFIVSLRDLIKFSFISKFEFNYRYNDSSSILNLDEEKSIEEIQNWKYPKLPKENRRIRIYPEKKNSITLEKSSLVIEKEESILDLNEEKSIKEIQNRKYPKLPKENRRTRIYPEKENSITLEKSSLVIEKEESILNINEEKSVEEVLNQKYPELPKENQRTKIYPEKENSIRLEKSSLALEKNNIKPVLEINDKKIGYDSVELACQKDESIIDVNTQQFNLSIEEEQFNNSSITPPYWEHKYVYSYNEIQYATNAQQEYYLYFKKKVLRGELVNIEGNTNYAFILYFDFINDYFLHKNIKLLETQFLLLGKICPRIKSYALVELKELLEARKDTYSRRKLKELDDETFCFENGYSDYDPNEGKLGVLFCDSLKLTKKEVTWLNKFQYYDNVFSSINECLELIVKQYCLVLHKTEEELKINDFTILIRDFVKKYLINEYCSVDYSEQNVYLYIFRIVENNVRESLKHTRKLTTDYFLLKYGKDVQEAFDKIIGRFILRILDKYKLNNPKLKEETQIKLNSNNIARWRSEFKIIKEYLKNNDTISFVNKVEQLIKVNLENPNIESIFFETSKLISQYDKVESLKYYARYVYYDLKSKKIDNKQLSISVKNTLFTTEEQFIVYEKIISDLKQSGNIDNALNLISDIYCIKRKRIILDEKKIQEEQRQSADTVNLLSKYLDVDTLDKSQDKNGLMMIDVLDNKNSNNDNIKMFPNLSLNHIHEGLINMMVNNSFKLKKKLVSDYALKHGVLEYQLIDSINDICEEHLEGEVLIEEEDDNYIIEESYYKEIAI